MEVQEILPNVYVNVIPLPKNPLKYLNSYILTSDERNLIIDTGFNLPECLEALLQGIGELDLDLKRTDLILTHMHPDHSGLADELRERGCRVMMSKTDGDMINRYRRLGQAVYDELNTALALGEDRIKVSTKVFGKNANDVFEFVPLQEGDVLQVGRYSLEVVSVPGHTPGQIGLYDREHKLFFAGDHILDEVSPNITFWGFEFDSLGTFIESLKKVARLEIDTVFPAHRSFIRDIHKRIDELMHHHDERLHEVIEILKNGRKSPIQTASEMRWDLKVNTWDDFPRTQKWFAAGEAMSHLEHLVYRGEAQRIFDEGRIFYELVNNTSK